MSTAPRHGRKGGKIVSSPAVAPRVVTPGSTMSPASLQTPGEPTTIISDLNAAHPFDPDANANATKKVTSTESNVLQFDMSAIQHIGKGIMVGRTKQVRTITRQPQASTADATLKLKNAFMAQSEVQISLKRPLGLEKLKENNVVVHRSPQESLILAIAISTTVPNSKVLVVVPKYFEVSPVKDYLNSLDVEGGKTVAGKFYGQTFEGNELTNLWVTTAETALLYLTKLNDIAPFTHLVVPGLSNTTQLLSCFVKAFHKWLLSGFINSSSVRLIVTPERNDCSEMERIFEGLSVGFVKNEIQQSTIFSYGETCALVSKEMMEMEKDSSGKFPGPTKRFIDYTAQIAAEVVRCIVKGSKNLQVIVIFTAEAREVLTALQDAKIENCGVYSGFKSTEETSVTLNRVYVMNHVRHALDTDNEYTMAIDMGTIRRSTAQHKSESFMAAGTTEWETKAERLERISILGGKKESCYFALYPDEVAASFCENAKSFPDIFSIEDAFIQCARLNLPMNEVVSLLPIIPAETTEQVMHNLSEKCMIANPKNLGITFIGEMAARLPVELDIACFIIGGSSIGLGEVALAIGSVAALPFRSTTPLTYSSNHWNECTTQSREKYGGDVARHSDLLADTLVFIEWLKLRLLGSPTSEFLDEILVQGFKLEKIEGLMHYMREQLTNYVFLERFDSVALLENIKNLIQENSAIILLLQSVAMARRAAFIRDAGHLNEKDRHASMAFVRTSKRLVPHNFIPSSVKWDTGRIMIPVILKNSNSILAGLFSLIHTPYFFASLLLLYPQVEYSNAVITDKGRVVYFGVSCNRQMKRFMVSIEEAAQILDFREKVNVALGCMQALRSFNQPISRTKFALALKEYDRLFDIERLHRDIRRQLHELVTELSVIEHQGSFETFATHCTAPKELLPMTDAPATDVAMLRRFATGTIWSEPQQQQLLVTPHSITISGGNIQRLPTPATAITPHSNININNNNSIFMMNEDDDDDDVEIIQESYFMRHGPIIEDDDDD